MPSPIQTSLIGFLALAWPGIGRAETAAAPVVLDVTRVLIFSNVEVDAMGGAGSVFAAGCPGMVLNPAASANRRTESVAPIFGSFALAYNSASGKRDLGNVGGPLDEQVRMLNVGLSGGYLRGAGGILAVGESIRFQDTWVALVEGHASAAFAFLDGQVVAGAGPRLLGMRVSANGERHDYLGSGVEAGAMLANWPHDWNFALTLRSGVVAGPLHGAGGGIDAARLPPGLVAGIGWSNLDNLPHDGGTPVRMAADMVLDAPVLAAVSLEEDLRGNSVPRGAWVTVSPRLGGEVDVWRDRFRLRGGTYLEPSRTALEGPRPHATGGFELRLFHVKALTEKIKLNLSWQMAVDWAPRYFRGAWFGIDVWQQGRVGGTYATRQ
jgi:hypothetical protein